MKTKHTYMNIYIYTDTSSNIGEGGTCKDWADRIGGIKNGVSNQQRPEFNGQRSGVDVDF